MSFTFFNDVPVLMYHKVTNRRELGVTTVTVDSFAQQMAWLKEQNYQTITPSEYSTKNGKSIIISFDDAYANIFHDALPIMEANGFKGLIFPINKFIGKKNTWDANLAGIEFEHASAQHLSELAKLGWEIGAHSKSHHIPTVLENLQSEIADCKKELEDLLSTKVTSFSYPFGYMNDALRDEVEKHYDFAFLANSQKSASNFLIPRTAVYSFDGIKQLKNKINLKRLECMKLNLIHSGSNATILYQKIKN